MYYIIFDSTVLYSTTNIFYISHNVVLYHTTPYSTRDEGPMVEAMMEKQKKESLHSTSDLPGLKHQ